MTKAEKEALYKEHLGFIKRLASSFSQSSPNDYDDLVQVGTEALLICCDKYDEEKGKFLTYAAHRIKYYMLDYMDKENKYSVTPHLTGIATDFEESQSADALDTNAEYQLVKGKLNLNSRNASILLDRYSDKSPTLNQLGKKYNITDERVRQVEKLTIEKLRKKLGINIDE